MLKEEISRKVLKYFELNENENTIYQNVWDAGKAVLRGKFIALNAYIRKEERSKTSHLSFHLRKIEKQEQIKSKVSRRKKKKEINEIEIRKSIEKINETKNWFFKISSEPARDIAYPQA